MNETAWLSHRTTLIFVLITDHAQNEIFIDLSYFKPSSRGNSLIDNITSMARKGEIMKFLPNLVAKSTHSFAKSLC